MPLMKISPRAATLGFTFAAVFLLGGAAGLADEKRQPEKKPQPVEPASVELFDVRNIEGWAVYIKKQNLVDHAAEMNRAIDHMHNQLYQVRLVLPGPAVAIMQERVPVWVEFDAEPGTAFHPKHQWLLERGYPSPKGLASLVSVSRARRFCDCALHQPWVMCHELVHGYDYMYLGQRRHYSNSRLEDAYQRAKKSGGYESVLCRYSQATRHYAMSNPMEYLAENSEAYFGTNDFYPFVRAELREHDPEMCTLLEDLFGVDVERQQRTTRSLVEFLESPDRQATGKDSDRQQAPFLPTSKYEKRSVEGWTVQVHPVLVRKKACGDEICKLLRYKLHLVGRYLPDEALKRLRQVPIWLEPDDPAVPYATYHASSEEIASAGLNPEKLQAIEIGNPEAFRRWQSLQPFMLMNRMARAYHDRFLGEEERAEIEEAWQRAVDGGKYDSVLRFDGRHVRHPALTSPLEFFAEMTESYYGVNDHYPFLQFEARQHDPETCRLLAKLWGGKAK